MWISKVVVRDWRRLDIPARSDCQLHGQPASQARQDASYLQDNQNFKVFLAFIIQVHSSHETSQSKDQN